MRYSIIVPSVDNFKFLRQCLFSIQENSGTTDYEVIIVDNGTTDSTTMELLKLIVSVELIKDDAAIPLNFKRDFLNRCKVIRNDSNQGFGRAINQGMAASSGDYIVWLNDDTIVSKNWLDKMASVIEMPNGCHPNIGVTGPMSNNALGKQSEGLEKVTPDQMDMVMDQMKEAIDKEAAALGQAGKFAPMVTSVISGFCLMMKREVFNAVGYIDDLYSPGGFCDNDYCIRVIEAGFGIVYDPYTFIYHYGHTTLDKIENSNRGLSNWAKYIKKWRTLRSENKNKILLVQRVKLDTEHDFELYKKCAEQNKSFVDGVIILSDRSKLLNYETAKEIWGSKLSRFTMNKEHDGFDERRDRLQLLHTAYDLKDEYSWCVIFDHDECFSDGTTVERLQELMNPMNPATFCYSFYLRNFWESTELIRLDDNWGKMYVSRMWRNIFPPVLRDKMSDTDKGLHCGNIPISIPVNGRRVCNLTVDHYGYINSEVIHKKYEFYKQMDTTPLAARKILVHETGSYDFIIQNKPMTMIKPTPFSISANIMCKNEQIGIGILLLTYFSLVDEFVIIDTGSTDNTVRWLKEVGITVHEMPLDNNFAKVRNKCIELSKSKYCMQIDPDERPGKDFDQLIVAALVRDPDVVIWHLDNAQKNGMIATTKQPRIFRRDPRLYFSGRVHEVLDKSIDNFPNIRFEDVGIRSMNTGFLMDDLSVKNKLEFYAKLLELEIQDNPDNYLAHFELALHHRNYDRTEKAIELLKKCHELNPKYLPAIRELSLIYASEAHDNLKKAQGLSGEAETIDSLRNIENILRPLATSRVKVGQV